MARESKRKRDERRFGKPERLADRILQDGLQLAPCSEKPGYDLYEHRYLFRQVVLDGLRDATCVVADNVAELVDVTPKVQWSFGDFPSPVPPWKLTFIEFAKTPWNEPSVASGCLFRSLYTGEDGGLPTSVQAYPVIETHRGVIGPISVFAFHFTENGSNITTCRSSSMGFFEHYQNERAPQLASPIITPSLMALSFMHCKNVTLAAVEPSKELNRERKKAGLTPFLRYHTINIEPMRKILRTEGGIETNGLRKALHIVRGHFSRYTEEKPLFGRPGLHGDFWMPSHTRGSLERGVVVSDYHVGPAAQREPVDTHAQNRHATATTTG